MPKSQSTQNFLPIQEIRDGVVVLDDGSIRSVLLASSLNFALKSNNEQEAILAQFQSFLNSLDFPVQFYIQSKKLNIRPYINTLEERYEVQKNDLIRLQTREYIGFIKEFTSNTDIMRKSFFIVIGYQPPVIDMTITSVSNIKVRSISNFIAKDFPDPAVANVTEL